MLFFYKKKNKLKALGTQSVPSQPSQQNNNSCMPRMPMFIFLVSRTSIKFQLSIDYLLNKKMYHALWWPMRTEITLTNLAIA